VAQYGVTWYETNVNASVDQNSFVGTNPQANKPLAYMILAYFNLTPWQHQTFVGNVEVIWGMNWGENGPLPFRLYTVTCAWDQASVSWQNYLGPGTTNNAPPFGDYPNNNRAYEVVFGEELALQQCYGTGIHADGTNKWTFAGSKIQYMLDDASKNFGIALVPQKYGNMMWCNHLRSWQPLRVPTLKAEVVPEPALLSLLGAGLLLIWRRK
jgi:hypothetical protein